ncbi:MAG TPA: hypothetical protein VGQ86_02320 [Candidatus Limnocylindria bacterium]|nr:hypothetical protein [Candidatus Limnocylindria bacterium]
MLLFRSEEHAIRWRERAKPPVAHILQLDEAARLAHAWYAKKLEPDWRRFTSEEAEAIFDDLGLDPAFWRLQ